MQEEMQPDRVYSGEGYFSLTNAQKYFGMSKSGFQDYMNRMKVQRWEMPAGSRNKFIRKLDLDTLMKPACVAAVKKVHKGKLRKVNRSIVQMVQ